jgi:hypothetical protein
MSAHGGISKKSEDRAQPGTYWIEIAGQKMSSKIKNLSAERKPPCSPESFSLKSAVLVVRPMWP